MCIVLPTLLLKLHHPPDCTCGHLNAGMASSGVKTTTKCLVLSNISSDPHSHCDNKSLLPIVSMIRHLKCHNCISVQSMKAYYGGTVDPAGCHSCTLLCSSHKITSPNLMCPSRCDMLNQQNVLIAAKQIAVTSRCSQGYHVVENKNKITAMCLARERKTFKGYHD